MKSDREAHHSQRMAMNKKDRKQQKKKERQERLRRQKHLRHFGGGLAVGTDTENPEWDVTDAADTDEQFRRIDGILGDSMKRGQEASVQVYFQHLRNSLLLSCEMSGRE